MKLEEFYPVGDGWSFTNCSHRLKQNSMTDSKLQAEIIEALQMAPEDLPPAQQLPPEESPLNYPVAEKHFEEPPQPEPTPKSPSGTDHAKMMADVILGAANNLIEVGGGFFINIKTDASFHEYAELIQVIEEQNQRNLKRLVLDEGDKAMLRPLIAEILRSREKVMSPEQQLLIALVSILIKKAQVVMEVRAENQILTERIKEIIQAESDHTPQPEPPQKVEPEIRTIPREAKAAESESRSESDTSEVREKHSEQEQPLVPNGKESDRKQEVHANPLRPVNSGKESQGPPQQSLRPIGQEGAGANVGYSEAGERQESVRDPEQIE